MRKLYQPAAIYTGVTIDINQRLRRHNAGQNTDTARDRPWSVVVSIEFNTERSALEFERYLKSGSGREFAVTRAVQSSL